MIEEIGYGRYIIDFLDCTVEDSDEEEENEIDASREKSSRNLDDTATE